MHTLESPTLNEPGTQQADWYAVRTRYQHEQLVNLQLERKGFQTFYPTCKTLRAWSDRKKKTSQALFPGYLFVSGMEDRHLQVKATAGVCGIVSVAGVPAPIPVREIDAIRRAVSSPYQVEAHDYLKTGAQVRIVDGPLGGITGILMRNEKATKIVLSIELLGRSVAVEIDARQTESAIA